MGLKKSITIAVIISAILHITAFYFFYFVSEMVNSEDASIVEIYLDQPDGGWQIADIPEPREQFQPDKAKFLGMYNQRVKDETVATAKELARRGEAERPAAEKEKKQDLYKFDKGLFVMKGPVAKEKTEASSGSQDYLTGSLPEDFYPDYKFGEHTYVNVQRYPEVEYFVRLKRIFKTTWNPASALRRAMASTSIYQGAMAVVLAVSVDKTGGLSELFVLKSSGIADYDDEALRAIKASSPFSAPPEKFIKDDGLLRMSWTFVFYI